MTNAKSDLSGDRTATRAQRNLAWAFLSAALLYHVTMVGVGWNRPIADFNPWRQSQTAIVAESFLESGPSLAYPVPVLGPGWSIPFEFPTYQALVAALSWLTPIPLEPSGRLVSLAAFYLALAGAAILLRKVLRVGPELPFVLALPLLAPTYISWSRAFSIESTALALGVWFLVAFHRWVAGPGLLSGMALISLGIMAGLTKATTFAGCLAATLPIAWMARRAGTAPVLSNIRGLLVTCILGYLIPVAATFLWTAYSDAVKASQPFTATLTSEALRTWNYGTLEQRLSVDTWRRFELFVGNLVIDRINVIFALICLALFPRWRWALLALAGLFILPPLVFTNLYFAHDYYWYANGLFVVLALGLAFAPLVSDPRVPLTAGILTCFLIFYQYRNAHASWYLPKQRTELSPALPLAQAINQQISANNYCVVYGFDWDPTLAYHSKRRMIMETAIHHGLALSEEPLSSTLDQAGRALLGGIAFVGESRNNRPFVEAQLAAAGLDRVPAYSDSFGTLYIPLKTPNTP
ncbi:MAG TPA: hypothetical protein VGD88_05350 [Opitutaceae bacterium]